jgi:hypothetical protein
MKYFQIGSIDGDYLMLQVFCRSHSADDYWDGNWVDGSVELVVGGFRGSYGACFRAEEFVQFRESLAQLYSLSSQKAQFETMEQQLTINVIGDKLGHFTAECEAIDELGIGNRLNFSLSFDQTEIPKILKELDNVINEFPVVGKPDV